MTDKVDSAIYIYDVEFDKVKTIKLKTFLNRVNHTLRNENQIYFATIYERDIYKQEYMN